MAKAKRATKQRQTVSGVLREAALADDRTVNALAVRFGITQPALRRFLTEGAGLSIDNVDKLAEGLGLELVPRRGR